MKKDKCTKCDERHRIMSEDGMITCDCVGEKEIKEKEEK
jgi:hypothetical protein